MRLENTRKVKPTKDLVVVEMQVRNESENGVYLGEKNEFEVKMYYGVVESMGPDTQDPLHCPGLKEGDIAIFSEFAGYHISTKDSKLHKIIRGYDIMATTTNLNKITESTLTPTADRVLIKVLDNAIEESGLYLSGEDLKDPRLADVSYAEILKKGPSLTVDFQIGDLIAYDGDAGESVRRKGSNAEPELRVIRGDDILFINK